MMRDITDIRVDFDAGQHFRNHPDPMWLYDPATLNFLAVNAAAVNQYGYSQDEFLAMTICDIYPAEDVESLRLAITQNQANFICAGLWRHRRKSGEIFNVDIISQVASYDGRPTRLVTARDASMQVERDVLLSRSQSLLRLATWELDLERKEAWWPSSAYEMFGLDPRTWSNTQENFLALLHPEDRDRYRRAQEEAIRSRSLFDIQYRARHTSGTELVLHEVGEVHHRRRVFLATLRDVTDFVNERAGAVRLEARMGDVIEGMSDAFYLLDQEWRFSYINCNAEAFLGKNREALRGRVLWEEFPEILKTKFDVVLREARSSGISRRVTTYYPPWGKSLEVTAHPGSDDLAVYFHDVTEKVRDAAQRELINVAISRLNDVVLITELTEAPGLPANRITYVNEAVRHLTGYAPEALIGQTPKIFQGPDTPGPALDRLNAAIQQCRHAKEELVNYTAQGEPYWVEINLSPIFNDAGDCTHFVAIERDVTDRKKSERALHLAATRDSLTGLPNRAAFTKTLQQQLKTIVAKKGMLALLFLDFDNFKNINDSLGHSIGDEVLAAVSQRLAEVVRQTDLLARFGGDEFVVVSPGADAAAARSLAERLIEAFREPFHLDSERISLTASIGIVVAPEDGEEAGELIRKADIAMYRSKGAGRNRATHFEDALNQDVLRNVGLTQALLEALNIGDGFSLVYQPQYELGDEPRLVGAEALLRWQHPEYGAVSPAEFIPAAERAGLIRVLDRHVIEMAIRQGGTWNRQSQCIQISVNVSTDTLEWEGLTDFILEQLDTHGVPPRLFGVEIIETRLLESSPATIKNLHELRRAGISIAIDDFGTGHSSLSYLQELPVDMIKIDQSFVQGLKEGKSRNGVLIRAILAMAYALELHVVAEGVETEEQQDWLRRNRCEAIQGFLFGRPVDPDIFARTHLARLMPD